MLGLIAEHTAPSMVEDAWGGGTTPGHPEPSLASTVTPIKIVVGTNTAGESGELDRRFESWPIPSVVSLAGNGVGDLPAIPSVTAGHGPPLPNLKLKDAADALL